MEIQEAAVEDAFEGGMHKTSVDFDVTQFISNRAISPMILVTFIETRPCGSEWLARERRRAHGDIEPPVTKWPEKRFLRRKRAVVYNAPERGAVAQTGVG
jgi:hypothetical protein